MGCASLVHNNYFFSLNKFHNNFKALKSVQILHFFMRKSFCFSGAIMCANGSRNIIRISNPNNNTNKVNVLCFICKSISFSHR